jgi:hypothetical protein
MKKAFLSTAAVMAGIILCCAALVSGGVVEEKIGSGRVSGQIGIKGIGPMMDGALFFFDAASGPPPSATRYWRVPNQVVRVDNNARFSAALPEGTYYLGAIERKTGELFGPPQEGDHFFIAQDAKGKPKELTVWKDSIIDLGILNQAQPFKRSSLETRGITSIEGVVRDGNGKGVEGMVVFAFTDKAMFGRPLFVSERSDKNGRYFLRVAGSGKYYLRARSNYGGGPPAMGEPMGVYQQGKPVVTTKGRIVKNANITLYDVGR